MKSKITNLILLVGLISNFAIAQDDISEKILSQESEAEVVTEIRTELDDKWKKFLEQKGWYDGANSDGVIYIEDKQLIISSASSFTEVSVGQPGWIESRIIAFERAELEAKAKIVQFLSETSQSEREFGLLEDASWSDGTMHELNKLNSAYEKLKQIANKTLDLTQAKLNQAITDLDPSYDIDQYTNRSPDNLIKTYENIYKRKINIFATRLTIGVTPIYNLEGTENGQHRVLVGVIWSPKLNKVAMSLFNDEYNIPALESGKKPSEYVSEDVKTLIGTLGTRIIVDENGEYAVLAYAQAQPRKTSKSRQANAINDAKSISADRARALITNFVREGITSQSSELSDEVSVEYSDTSNAASIVREYRDQVIARNDKIKVKGLSPIKQWYSKHPASGQTVVGTVMLWSPSNLRASESMAETMTNADKNEKDKDSSSEKPSASGNLLESLEVDTSAY